MSTQTTPTETTRERILEAALDIFAERGFEGARTRDIAERAGANLGLIKYYFDGKEALWKAAVDRAFAELQARFGDALEPAAGGDDRAHMEQMVRRFVRFAAEHPQFIRIMNDEGKRDGERQRWLSAHYGRPMFRMLRERLERAQARGALPTLPAASFFYILVGAAGLIFSQAPECREVTGVDPLDERAIAAHEDAIVTLLFGSPGR
jgi:TetR/AcrR family transcriptional regulator